MSKVGSSRARGAVLGATLACGALVAQLVAAKAARDGLFLSSFDVRLLPRMMTAAAVVSLISAFASSRAIAVWSPARVVPAALAANALLYGVEWTLLQRAPSAAALTLYLHVAMTGSTLIAGLWSMVNETFDPHTAKRHVASIAMGGTLGGALGGLAGWKLGPLIGIRGMLALLTALNVAGMLAVWLVARQNARAPAVVERTRTKSRSGLAVLAEHPYLRQLALLVGLVAVSSALLDYLLSARVAATTNKGPELVAFFALFHMSVGLTSFALQALVARDALARLGLAGTTALLPTATLLSGVFGLVVPGLGSAILMRGSDALMQSSLYRAAYELFYTPVPRHQKRPAKMLIDVGVDRVGTAVGSGLVMLVLAVSPGEKPLLIVLAMVVAAGSLITAARLHHGYVSALARSLERGAIRLRPASIFDAATRRTLAESARMNREKLLASIERLRTSKTGDSDYPPASDPDGDDPGAHVVPKGHDAGFGPAPLSLRYSLPAPESGPNEELTTARDDLRSDDIERARNRLATGAEIPIELVPTVIGLLEKDELSRDALQALRSFGEGITDQLVQTLLDANQPLVVRRRVPRVLETIAHDRAVLGLLDGLFEPAAEVRHQCAWALERLTTQSPELSLPRARILDAVREELMRARRALSDPDSSAAELPADSLRAVEQAVLVLSLVLEREPLQLAYRALRSDDANLRGTALEYFENVIPESIRAVGLPLMDRLSPRERPKRDPRELKEELLRSRTG